MQVRSPNVSRIQCFIVQESNSLGFELVVYLYKVPAIKHIQLFMQQDKKTNCYRSHKIVINFKEGNRKKLFINMDKYLIY